MSGISDASSASEFMRMPAEAADYVDHAIRSRRSIRRFRSDPVAAETIHDILDIARHAPSGTNMQPWFVEVLAGDCKRALSAALCAAFDNSGEVHSNEFEYYPEPFPEPYLSRRRKVGWDLYGALGIVKGDSARMREQSARNYLFFDAPVGMIFTIERTLKTGSWLDYGMFLQNIAVAARARGLDTCMQAAFARFHTVIRAELGLSPDRVVICGMSLGYADTDAPENRFIVAREPVETFASFSGF